MTERLKSYAGVVVVPALSILLALGVASILIILSGGNPLVAYRSLLVGAFGSVKGISNMIVAATPLILTGLAVGVGLKAGLFNIGATGQVLLGGFAAALVGSSLAEAPPLVAISGAVAAGLLAGAFAGFIPGFLKAFTGAHEVVTTIMLNALIQLTVSGLVTDIFRVPGFTFAAYRLRRQRHLERARGDHAACRRDRGLCLRPDLLLASVANDSGVRDPNSRGQSNRGAVCRDESPAHDHPDHVALRGLRRTGGCY